jgi:hypothetical protein
MADTAWDVEVKIRPAAAKCRDAVALRVNALKACHDRNLALFHTFNQCRPIDAVVIFTGIMQRREVLAPFDQLIRDTRHGGDHDSDLMAGIHLSLHAGGDIADTIQISD